MKNKKLQVKYWRAEKYQELDIEHNAEFPYSDELRETITTLVLSKGLSVMIKQYSDSDALTLWIDRGSFKQS